MSELNLPLLLYLRARPGLAVAPAMLSEHLGLSLERLWKDVEGLRQLGFQIESGPHQGLRYAGPSPRLCPELIEHELATQTIGRTIRVYASCRSTNDLAWAWVRRPEAHGAAFLAEYQTAGRGRQGARWFSPAQTGLLCSVLLMNREPAVPQKLLVCLGAAAAAMTVREPAGLDAKIKWPNDVRVGRQKVAGVLVESSPEASVLGIGINVNTPAEEFPTELDGLAASMRSLTGQTFDRSALACHLLKCLDTYYQWVTTGDDNRFWDVWMHLADFAGSRAWIEASRQRIAGRIVDFLPHEGVIFCPDGGCPYPVHPSHILDVQY